MLDGIYSTPSVSCSTYAQSNGEIRLHLDTGTGGLSSDSSLSISCDDPEPASEEPPPATRSFAQSPTSTLDDDSQRFLIDNAVTSRSKTMALRVADHFLNLFVVTPFIIVYWASSWDIIYVYLFPKDLKISYLITFAFSNIFLFVSYCLQTRLQKFHDSLASRKTYSPGSVQNNHYYDQRFVVRFCYTYMLTWAYVAQWRTYWDLYNTLTSKIEFEYFIGISLVTLLLYRYVLRCSFGSYTQMVPFLLQPDLKFNEYFIQAKVRLVKYVSDIYRI